MRRNIFMLIFFILSLLFIPDFVEASQGKLIPITMGDIERNKTFTPKERREFIVEYYLKNKKNGATDEQIVNEILKLFEFKEENLEKIKKIALLGKRYKTFEDMIQDTVNKINLSILEKYPGRTDMLIDVDDSSTWKNVKNLYVGKTKISDFFKAFQNKLYLSNVVASENLNAFLMSCADMAEKDEITMSFVLMPTEGTFLATQEEGKPFDGFQVDFSGSENLTIGSVLFPMEKSVSLNGKATIS